MKDQKVKDFDKIYDRCLFQDCPPSEGVKKKVEGCFNAINNYGEDPTEENCRECWKIALKKVVKGL